MTADPGNEHSELWMVVSMRSFGLSPKPLRHTSWHTTKERAIDYAKSVVRRGGEVLRIDGWGKTDEVDLRNINT